MAYTIKQTLLDGFLLGYLAIVSCVLFLGLNNDQIISGFGTYSSAAIGCFFLGGLLAVVLKKLNIITIGGHLFAPPHMKVNTGEITSWYKTFWGLQLGLSFVVTLVVGIYQTHVSVIELLRADSISHVWNFLTQILQPDWGVLPKAVMKVIETIFIAFMATVIAVPAAFVLSFFCAKNIMSERPAFLAIYTLLRTLFNISRSIEPILWAIIFSIWVGFGPFAGMLALMIHSIASLAKQFSEIVECSDDGPIEGIRATGAGFLQTIWFAIVPQIVLPYISFTIYRWDINVRMATIIGFVGGGGIGELLLQYQGQARWPQVGTIIVVIAFVVWVMDAFSAYVREAIK